MDDNERAKRLEMVADRLREAFPLYQIDVTERHEGTMRVVDFEFRKVFGDLKFGLRHTMSDRDVFDPALSDHVDYLIDSLRKRYPPTDTRAGYGSERDGD